MHPDCASLARVTLARAMIDKLKAWTPLNFDLMANPVNWVIVVLMVAIAGLALSLLFHPVDFETGD